MDFSYYVECITVVGPQGGGKFRFAGASVPGSFFFLFILGWDRWFLNLLFEIVPRGGDSGVVGCSCTYILGL